jgi:hypothetical protein
MRNEKKFHFGKGNAKLGSNIPVWDLPRLKTCPMAGICKEFCYEIKTERMYKSVLPCRERNLAFTKRKEFVPEVVTFLNKRKETLVRIHSSGDMYSETYFEKWKEIARRCPTKQFYCYTKSCGLFDVVNNLPSNLIMIQSNGSKRDERINLKGNTARVIEHEEECQRDETICPVRPPYKLACGKDCMICQNPKQNGKIHVCFLKH